MDRGSVGGETADRTLSKPISFKDCKNLMAKAICSEQCAFMGEPACHKVKGPWPNPACNEPGCMALAEAALSSMPIWLRPGPTHDRRLR